MADKKASIATEHVNDLVQKIIKMRLEDGKSHYYILEWLKSEHGYKQVMAYNIIRKANETIAETYRETVIDLLENRVSELEGLKDKAMKEGDTGTALKILQEISKLQGLHIDKQEIKQTIITVKLDEE